MDITIKVLLIVLILAATGAAIKLFLILGDVKRLLGSVETTLNTTQAEVTETLKRLETVAQSTDKILREEVGPTLRVARETLTNVEVTTRAVADTTLIARRLAGKADNLVDSQRLLAAGGTVAQAIAQKSGKAAIGLLAGIGAGVGTSLRYLWSRHKKQNKQLEEKNGK